MTPDPEAFYAARDARTVQYGGDPAALQRPIRVEIGPKAGAGRPGQVAALALVNLLARVHRRLHLVAPRAALRAKPLVAGADLLDALVATARAINPVIAISAATTVTDSEVAPDDAIGVGIGADTASGMDLYPGWAGGRGEIDTSPLPTAGTNHAVLGAATAACLTAAAVFRLAHGRPVRPTRLNLVERTADDQAGTTSLLGPVDVGDVLVVGAGAVTHALLYWLREVGVAGHWEVVDGDIAELHNTNRCLGMTAADAGWPTGAATGTARDKAPVAAELIGAAAHPAWYHEYIRDDRPRPDLVLPLANEHGVRAAVAARGETLLLHATTSPDWTAELHRHLAERDDCPACRLPDTALAAFACSTGPAQPGADTGGDAALPFLSAAAGLLLAVALLQLPRQDGLLTGRVNHWRLHLELRHRLWQRSIHPAGGCPHRLDARICTEVHTAQPRRWDAAGAPGTPPEEEHHG